MPAKSQKKKGSAVTEVSPLSVTRFDLDCKHTMDPRLVLTPQYLVFFTNDLILSVNFREGHQNIHIQTRDGLIKIPAVPQAVIKEHRRLLAASKPKQRGKILIAFLDAVNDCNEEWKDAMAAQLHDWQRGQKKMPKDPVRLLRESPNVAADPLISVLKKAKKELGQWNHIWISNIGEQELAEMFVNTFARESKENLIIEIRRSEETEG